MSLFEIILHVDQYLGNIVQEYGIWAYAILFIIVFCETGLVITPFLPGDSLLFAAGALAVKGLNAWVLLILLSLAAILGDTVNYWLGNYAGPKVFTKEHSWIFHREYLEKARRFYEKHGAKAIVLARFIPIIRTFAPFVAGIGSMRYGKFLLYNIIGGIVWVAIFVLGGYFFGNIPVVEENFSLVILAIIVISLIPLAIEVLKHWWHKA